MCGAPVGPIVAVHAWRASSLLSPSRRASQAQCGQLVLPEGRGLGRAASGRMCVAGCVARGCVFLFCLLALFLSGGVDAATSCCEISRACKLKKEGAGERSGENSVLTMSADEAAAGGRCLCERGKRERGTDLAGAHWEPPKPLPTEKRQPHPP